ncbi:tetratricopeptide repeat protein [Roseibium sp.]|uniref:tetratricopeptide repeat protein n=1 Tax=Roseibium sp. TaxID=1936156 RepID=UPI003BAA108B
MTTAPRFRQLATGLVLSAGVLFLAACSSSEEKAEAHYKRGLELVEQGELTKAGLEFRNAFKLKSDHVDALFAFGEIQERQRNIQAAFRIYNAVAEQAGDHVEARLKLAYMLMTANQIEQARKFLDQANEIAAEKPEVLVANGTYALRNNNPEEAERLAEEALKGNPELEDAFVVLASSRVAVKDFKGALAYLDKAPGSSAENVGMQVLRLSILDSLRDDEKIEKQLSEMVERFPEMPQFAVASAQWYMSRDRHDDAERLMRKVAEDRPDDTGAQLRLVAFLASQGGPEAAQTELEKLIEARKQGDAEPFPIQAALAQLKFTTGERPEAIDFMQSVLAETDETEQKNRARLILAAMLIETGKIDQAEGHVTEILEADNKNVEALRMRASIKLSNNDSAGAADDILLALNEAPNDARLRVMLANAHERNGSSVLAEEEFAKAFALDNQSVETGLPMVRYLLSHGRAEQAERILETIRTRNPNNREVLALIAQQKLAQRDFVGAQEIADTLRNLEDQGYQGFADRITAAALGGQEKHDESLELLQNSMANSGRENQALLPDLVRAYVQSGQQELAVEKLNAVLEETPEDVQARVLLGAVYMASGDADKAEAMFKQAASNGSNASGNSALAQYYFSTQEYDKAEEAVRAGLEKDKNSIALQMMLTTVLQQTERFDDAIAVYEDMFERNPGSTIVANDLASLLSERRSDEASLERALEIAQRFRTSEVPQYQDTLGWIYYLKGEYSSALPLLRNSAQQLTDLGLAQYHYGMTLAALGQKEEAIETLQRALDLKTLMTEQDQAAASETVERLQKAETATESN